MSKKDKYKYKSQIPAGKTEQPQTQAPSAAAAAETRTPVTRFNFNWIGATAVWFALSILVIVLGIGSMVYKGVTTGQPLNWGIDFTGGTVLTVRFPQLEKAQQLPAGQKLALRKQIIASTRQLLTPLGLGESQIQASEADVTIRSRALTNDERLSINQHLAEQFKAQLIEVDTIGPTVGKQLQRQALWILLAAVILLVIYITVRFEFWYAVSAILADLHDAFVMLGLASILNLEINIAFMAALLTILGYSINDTIIVFDRIRENSKLLRRESFANICNLSINQTLNRTINTVATTLLAVLAILIFGGVTIRPFALAIFIGLVSGTYSSICNASPLLVIFKKWGKK